MINLTKDGYNEAVFFVMDHINAKLELEDYKDTYVIMDKIALALAEMRSILFITDKEENKEIDFPNSASKDSEDGSDPFDE